MELLRIENWPLLVVSLGMIACAVIDWWKFKVPNYLTFPLMISGLLLGALHNFGVHLWGETGHGGAVAALAGIGFGFLLLLPILAIGGVGAGDVKMTMGFGAWVGAFFGGEYGCLWIIFYSFCAGVIIGGILSLIMMAIRGEYHKYLDHTRVILTDLVTVGSVSKIAERAAERKPRWHKLPYGIPLCLGFVGFLVLAPSFAPKVAVPHELPSSQTAPEAKQVCANYALFGVGCDLRR